MDKQKFNIFTIGDLLSCVDIMKYYKAKFFFIYGEFFFI